MSWKGNAVAANIIVVVVSGVVAIHQVSSNMLCTALKCIHLLLRELSLSHSSLTNTHAQVCKPKLQAFVNKGKKLLLLLLLSGAHT